MLAHMALIKSVMLPRGALFLAYATARYATIIADALLMFSCCRLLLHAAHIITPDAIFDYACRFLLLR